MAAQSSHPAPTGRYIKAYLITWGLLAAGGLGYLGSLAWSPDLLTAPPASQIAEPEPDPGLRAATRALAEIGTVRRTLGDVQKDLGQVRETIELREAQDKAVQSRLSALEERVPPPPVASAAPEGSPKQRSAERAKADKARKVAERKDARVISVDPTPAAPPAAAPDTGPPVALETGSIVAPPAIAFGEVVVTPTATRTAFGVQLAAGPSLEALRLSWSMLVERHGPALGALQPRFVPPRAEGAGTYRLVAGPLPSRADAEKVCTEMGVGRNGCFSTAFVGEPL